MRNYGKDYKKNGDGYEYVGAWYETSLPAAELKQEAKFFGGKLLAASLLLACGLSVNNIGSHTFWVLIPYAGMILPVIYGWMGCHAMMRTAKKRSEQEPIVHLDRAEHASHLRRSEYEQAFRRPLRCGIATASTGMDFLCGRSCDCDRIPGAGGVAGRNLFCSGCVSSVHPGRVDGSVRMEGAPECAPS